MAVAWIWLENAEETMSFSGVQKDGAFLGGCCDRFSARLPGDGQPLGQDFTTAKAPNEDWLSDLAYAPIGEGWLYPVGRKDLFTAEIVGYALGVRMTTALLSHSLWLAVATHRPARGLSHHSDQGSP